ncbi:EAL domain-containing protein [Halomonas sp. 18H]|uniref:EAL domain-containing protein n=1 Tax=Halomonas almeriensis TaxID=308163 RepID=UPI00223006A7|nr:MULTISPECIES: EAL domain-containing protein [Halomonas]MCW4152794.1 EAL domain-containing protein [Halomonas sp. 18H]MDN3552006.1 EAL domain-containing protein [Halomonas almeriensis]
MKHCARTKAGCRRCEGQLPFDFNMAFQPIVDVAAGRIHAYEALVRGPSGATARDILDRVSPLDLYRFDQACRVKAIDQASHLGMTASLSINFLPNAVYEPEACLEATLEISRRLGWPADRLTFEIVESEAVRDREHLRNIIATYREHGFCIALDDFGSGYANLDLLVELTPDSLKLDRLMVTACHRDPRRQTVLAAILGMARELDVEVVAEGVELQAEASWLLAAGIRLQQGFYYGSPCFNALSDVPVERMAAVQQASGRDVVPS